MGDSVLVDVNFFPNDPQNARTSAKLAHKRVGSFKIIEKLSPTTSCLDLPALYASHPVLNIAALTRFVPDAFPTRVPPPALPVLAIIMSSCLLLA